VSAVESLVEDIHVAMDAGDLDAYADYIDAGHDDPAFIDAWAKALMTGGVLYSTDDSGLDTEVPVVVLDMTKPTLWEVANAGDNNRITVSIFNLYAV